MKSSCRIALVVSFALWGTSAQASLCVDLGGVMYVYDASRFPAPGRCKPWVGFVESGGLCPGGEKAISSGTICSSVGRDSVSASIISTCHSGWQGQENDYVFTDNFWLYYGDPAAGGERFVALDTGNGARNMVFDVTLKSCNEKFGTNGVPFSAVPQNEQ